MVMIRNYQQPGDFGVLRSERPKPVGGGGSYRREYHRTARPNDEAATKALLGEIAALLAQVAMPRRRFEVLAEYPELLTHMDEGRTLKPETVARIRSVMANVAAGASA